MDAVLLRLYALFFKGDLFSNTASCHIPLLYFFLSLRYLSVRRDFSMCRITLWCVFYLMVSVDAGSCRISFLDLCDVTEMENCITVAKTAHFIAVFWTFVIPVMGLCLTRHLLVTIWEKMFILWSLSYRRCLAEVFASLDFSAVLMWQCGKRPEAEYLWRAL